MALNHLCSHYSICTFDSLFFLSLPKATQKLSLLNFSAWEVLLVGDLSGAVGVKGSSRSSLSICLQFLELNF